METQQQLALSCDDDFLISMLFNDFENPEIDDQAPMSDAKFAEELQLQEIIVSSLLSLQNSGNDSAPKKASMEIGESSQTGAEKAGESSQSQPQPQSQSLCEICAEGKVSDDMFPLQNCSHSFCTECISKHISIMVKKNRMTEKGLVACPGVDCTTVLEIDTCRDIVPGGVLSVWDEVICESMISPSLKFYCPYKNCSELLVRDSDDQGAIREAVCPFCNRLFCANCNVPWHSGVDCEEFSRLGANEREREDLMVYDLAKEKQWQRCPSCRFFVEKNQGCLHMTCRCGYQFCYACGKTWGSTHGGCQ